MQGWSGVSHPAYLFTHSGEKEHHKKDWDQQKGNGRFGEWSPQEKHDSLREHHDQRHQEHDGHIPDLVLDARPIENALQEPLDATRLLFSGNENERRYDGTNELKRTHR
jgi:hypothetical protein